MKSKMVKLICLAVMMMFLVSTNMMASDKTDEQLLE